MHKKLYLTSKVDVETIPLTSNVCRRDVGTVRSCDALMIIASFLCALVASSRKSRHFMREMVRGDIFRSMVSLTIAVCDLEMSTR